MKIKRDIPDGILFIVLAFFPLTIVWDTAKGLWPFITIILCMRLYDLLFDFGVMKLLGSKEEA